MLDEQTSSLLRVPEILSPADWDELRSKSLRPGGFGHDRVKFWPKLLNVVLPEDNHRGAPSIPEESTKHQDERQIGLDTNRSFVLYPVGGNCSSFEASLQELTPLRFLEEHQDKDALQAELHHLLVSFFRKRPKMSYFQGYHDIISVLFLTLPKELHLPCAEKLSLHRLRDSMGSGLEPVLGLLRITKSLLRRADPEYAELLESTSPLPFYALSNLLTLFSHDTPTLPLIQHIFDYLFCRPPIASVYLTVVILLSRKEDVLRLHEEDEEGMIHSLLSSFPLIEDRPIDDENSHKPPASPSNEVPPTDRPLIAPNPTPAKDDRSTTPIPKAEEEIGIIEATHASGTTPKLESRPEFVVTQSNDVHTPTFPALDDHETTSGCVTPDRTTIPLARESDQTSVKHDSPQAIDDDLQRPPDALTAPCHPEEGTCDLEKVDEARVEADLDSAANPPSASTDVLIPDEDDKPQLKAEGQPEASPPSPNMVLQLSDLLRRADELYSKFPPTHPSLGIPSIMGPQSVVFTWSENPSLLPSDNTAEAMVTHPELVVYPYVEPAPPPDSKEKVELDEKATPRKHHRWRRRGGPGPFGQVEKRTAAVVASAAVVLAVAVAVYGIRSRPGPDRLYLSWLSVFY